MPYIGRDLNRGNYLKLDDISSSFNGSTKTFNLTVGGSAFTPGSAFSILVSVGGVIQEPESAYQVNNSEITFANAPTAQDGFFCIALGIPLGIGVPGSGTVNGPQIAKPFNYDGFFYLNDASNRVGINSSIPTSALDVSGTIKASSFSGPIGNSSGISTFYDLRVSNNLTVEGTTTTLDTNLVDVDRVEVGANSNTLAGIAVTQSGLADLVQLYDGATNVLTVTDTGDVGIRKPVPGTSLHVRSTATGGGNIAYFDDTGSGVTGRLMILTTNGVSGGGIKFQTVNKKYTYFGTSTNKLTIDNNNSRIGINTDNPEGTLDVNGTSKFQGVTTHNDHVSIGVDSKQLRFGASNDLAIEHNGSDSYITSNTGNFVIQHSNNSGDFEIKANDFYVKSYANEKYIRAQADGAVELYHNDIKRLETTASGITLTGTGPAIYFNDTNNSVKFTITGDSNVLKVSDNTNGDRLQFNSNGTNSFYGFLSVGGSVYGQDGLSTNGHIDINDDNDKLRIGAGDDLQIYHSTFNYIESHNDAEIHINANTGGSVENMAKFKPNGAVELYHDNSKKFFTVSNGIQATNRIIVGEGTAQRGLLSGDANSVSVGAINDIPLHFIRNSQLKARIDGNDFQIPTDNGKIELGASQDLEIFHSGSHSFILNNTGNLVISNMDPDEDNEIHLRARQNEQSIVCKNDGAVELYHNGSMKLDTRSSGVGISDNLFLVDSSRIYIGSSNDFELYHDGSNSHIKNATGTLIFRSDNYQFIDKDNGDVMMKLLHDGAVELYHDNSKKFETSSSGVTVTGDITVPTTMDSTESGGVAIQRFWAFTVSAGNVYKCGKWTTGEGTVQLLIAVRSHTAGNSGTTTYMYQGSFSAIGSLGIRRLMPLTVGTGHGNGPDNGTNSNAWEVLIKNDNNYAYEVYVHVPTGVANKVLKVTVTEVGRGMTFTDISSTVAYSSLTVSSGVILSSNYNHLGYTHLRDNYKINLGNDDDFQLFHNGTNSFISNTTGIIQIDSDSRVQVNATEFTVKNAADNETMARFIQDGASELWHNNIKTLETLNEGIKIHTGSSSTVIRISSNTDVESIIQGYNSDLLIKSPSGGNITLYANGTEAAVNCIANGAVELYENGTKRVETFSQGLLTPNTLGICFGDGGCKVSGRNGSGASNGIFFMTNSGGKWQIDGDGHFKPSADNSYDIGLTGTRVRNIHSRGVNVLSPSATTNDLDMIVLDGGQAGFNGGSDSNTEYGIQFKGCSFGTGGIGTVQRIGGQITFRKEGSWNNAAGGGSQCRTTIAFTSSTGQFNNGTLAQQDRLRITSTGEIQCVGADDNKGFAVYISDTQRVAELIEHSADGELRLYTGNATPLLKTVITSYGHSYIDSAGTNHFGLGTNTPKARLDVRGTALIADDVGSTIPNTFPASNVQLMVYTSTLGQPIDNTNCARLLIATDAKQVGAQGYHGAIDFGSSDASASGGAAEFQYRCAAIMCRGDGDTSPAIGDGDLQFYTKQASSGLTHRFDIAPNGTLTGTDTDGIGSLSDQRLKTNIQDYTYDLNKFKQLKTRTFDWINPEFHQEGNIRGFIAQEIETVDPYWNYQFEVSKETAKKDYDLLSDGDENYTIIDHRPGKASKLNGKDAMYVSVIQQLMSKIETLEAKVAALEGS